jgi:hypothetical protein
MSIVSSAAFRRTGILWSVAFLAFCVLTSCAVRDLEVKPLDTASTEPITVSSPVKAHLTDGSTVVFEEGVTVAEGKLTGEGRKYDLALETSAPVSSIALDEVAAMESYQTPVDAGETAAMNVAGAPFVGLGLLMLLLLAAGATIAGF